MRTLLIFTKMERMRLLSHLDMTRLFRRAMKRADVDICYTEGFNPQQKITVTNPLPLGYESMAEIMMIETDSAFTEQKMAAVNRELPKGIRIVSYRAMEEGEDIHKDYRYSVFEIRGIDETEEYCGKIKEISEKSQYLVSREITKKGKRRVQQKDWAQLIGNADCREGILTVTLGSFDVDTVRPSELVHHIAKEYGLLLPERLMYRRTAQQKSLNKA